ncbi:hypothetical protein AB0M29_10920 [Streptomyces sp. NPDC051976]|uniref:hypothetical protein n=1 Tax=Streptomyces sp. NPDC051976 TaxID=3154947 RepID=UPI0034127FAB
MIELDALLQQVPAEYHAAGALVEHMVTARAFHADSLFGECPVPVAALLYRPTADTHPALIVVDGLAETWVMEFDVWHDQVRYHITGFYPPENGRLDHTRSSSTSPCPSVKSRAFAVHHAFDTAGLMR